MIFSSKNKIVLLIFSISLIIGLGLLSFNKSSQPAIHEQSNKQNQEQQTLLPAINGLMVEQRIAKRRPVAVIIENHPDSRPQSGLSEADIVYEALAEGGITRFLAIFQTKNAESIGPVRSARDYFASIANDYGSLFVHVGGSDEVLAELQSNKYGNLDDLNQFYQDSYFERVKTRPAPHNVYTSIDKLRSYLETKKLPQHNAFAGWSFAENENPDPIQTAKIIEIPFSLPSFKVGYTYNQQDNNYTRSIAGVPHLDSGTKDAIAVKNIIVQYVSITSLPDDPKLHINIQLTGTGKGLLFKDSKVVPITWTKKTGQVTKYLDSVGQEISLNRGATWVELVPQTNKVTWKGIQ